LTWPRRLLPMDGLLAMVGFSPTQTTATEGDADVKSRLVEFARREAECRKAEAAAASKMAAVSEAEVAHKQAVEEITAQHQAIVQREETLRLAEDKLRHQQAEQQRGAAEESQRLEQLKSELALRESVLEVKASELLRRHSEQATRQGKLEQDEARFAGQKAEDKARLELHATQIAQRESLLDFRSAELAARMHQLELRAGELARCEADLYQRANEVQTRHQEIEHARMAAMQHPCAHQIGLVLNNTRTPLSTARDGISQFCDVGHDQVVHAAPPNKYPLLLLLSQSGGRLAESDGINPDTIQGSRQMLAPGGKLVLVVLRPGQLNTFSGSGAGTMIQLRDEGHLEIDALVDLCTDSYIAERPLHPPSASKMNEDSFTKLKELMPPPPPPPPDLGPLFAWNVAS